MGMILTALSDYIKDKQRVEESVLLVHFHLQKTGLAPMMEILIRHGHIQKTVHQRGEKLPPQVFYRWHASKMIAMTCIV